jgi:hypothetical protein
MTSFTTGCPACGATLRLLEKYRGTQVKCPDCGKAFAADAIETVQSATPEEPVEEVLAAQPARVSRQRWEYHVEDILTVEPLGSLMRRLGKSYQRGLERAGEDALTTRLAALGRQGWELVYAQPEIGPTGEGMSMRLIFKRPAGQ